MLYLSPPQKNWKSFKLNVGDCEIKSVQSDVSNASRQRVILAAETKLKYRPKISSKHVLSVPEVERKELEAVLHLTGNLIAISEFCARGMKSPYPCVAFVPESQKERDFLNSTAGVKSLATARSDFRFSLQDVVLKQSLLDRQEGCEFVAAALSQDSTVGQLHEYVRLFERAFSLDRDRLASALKTFLGKSDVVYTKNEIKDWVVNLRDGATHADRRNNLVFEPDAQKRVIRMRQAAYDVLLNKSKWYDPSTERRETYTAPMGLLEDNTPYATVNSPPYEGIVRMRDQFDVFSLDLNTIFNSFPEEWHYWYREHGHVKVNEITTDRNLLYVFSKTDKKTIDNKYNQTAIKKRKNLVKLQ